MSTNYLILRRQTIYSLREAISSFRNRKMLFVYEYCLMCYNKCLIFICKQEGGTCQHVRHISVSDTIPRHKGPFWSVMFPLTINSSKFLTEVLHTKFHLPYFVYSTYTKACQRMEKIVGLIIEQIVFWHERLPDLQGYLLFLAAGVL